MPSAKASLACVTHAGLVPRFLLLTFKTPSRTFQIVSVTCLIRQRNHISLSYTGAFSALRFHSSSCKRRVCRAQTRLGCRRSLSLSLSGLSSTHFQHPAQDHPHLLQGLVLLLGVLPGPTSTGSPARGLPQELRGHPQWGWSRHAGVLEDCTHRGQILRPAGPRPHGHTDL